MTRPTAPLLCLLSVLLIAAVSFASIPLVQIGTWRAAGSMLESRSGAASSLLADGRVLVIGGDNGSGPVASAELFDTTGVFVPAPPMSVARSGHSATVMSDGRVLVAGGSTIVGTTNAAEIFDPSANSWTAVAGGMTEARANHTALLLANGRVLIAGGENGGVPTAGLEIFDPISGVFLSMGTMASPRSSFASASLTDGRVLLIGGFDGNNPLATTEIFDPVNSSISPGPALPVPLMGHSATTLLDGTVLVAGGNDGTADLASAEIYDTATAAFTSITNTLATSRQGHLAFLLPHNNNVLIVGGTSNGSPLASAELFTPWQKSFFATGSLATPRTGATGNPMQQDGSLWIAGGKDSSGNTLSSAELYGFPTVKTDKPDYPPGTTVAITGSGWTPGETVTLSLVESPLTDTHGPYTAVVQQDGTFSNNSFMTDQADFSIHFTLTATGSISAISAQTAFWDNKNLTITFAGTGSGTVTSSGGSGTINCTDTAGSPGATGCSGSFNNNDTVTLTDTPTFPSTFAGWTVTGGATITSGTCTSSSTTCTFNMNNNAIAVTAAFNPGPAAEYVVNSSNNNPAAGSPITVTAQLADSSGNPVHTSGETVTWSKAGNGGSFSAGTSTTNSNGVATVTFTTGTVAGTVYSFTATDNSNATGTSGNVTTTAGPLAQLVFLQQPTNTVAGVSISPAVQVQLEDANGNVLTADSGTNVTAVILNNAGAGTLSGTTTMQDVNGVAAFSDLAINKIGNGYTLRVNRGNTNVISAPFNITSRSTTTVVSLNPTSVQPGGASQITVTVTDAGAGTQSIPSGTVLLTSSDTGANGDTFTSCTLTSLGGNSATCTATVTTHEVGTSPHSITATYTPNDNVHSSSNGNAPLTVVNPATTTSITSSSPGNSSTFADAVTLTANVTSTSGTPTGSATFIEGTTCPGIALTGSSANPATLIGGQASFTISTLTAGSHTITACYTPTGNFDASNGSVTQTVGKATPSITWSNPADIIYGTLLSATQLNATTSVPGSFVYTPVAGTKLNAGLGQNLHVDFTPTDTTDYNNASKDVTINVNRKPVTAVLSADDKPYDTTATEPDAKLHCALQAGSVMGTDDVSCGASAGTFNSKDVATANLVTATVTLTGSAANNYTLGAAGSSTDSIIATATAHILTAPLTPTLIANDKTYNANTVEPDANMSCTLATVFPGDTVNCAATNGAFNSKDVTTANQVNATVTISGPSVGNYTLGAPGTSINSAAATATAHIKTAPLTATLTALDKVYDATTAEPDAKMSCTVATVLAGDTVTCTASNGSFNTKDVLTANLVTANVSIGGTSAGNYTLGLTGSVTNAIAATATAHITPRPLTVTATGVNKTYDGTTSASVTLSDNRLGSDLVVDSYVSANFLDKNAGNNKTISITGITISGADSPNYSLQNTSATATANIAPASTSTTLTSSVNPSTLGQSVMFTATVANTATSPTPTGSVQFMIDNSSFGAAVQVSSSGTAILSTPALGVGAHSVQAVYTNTDGNFVSSSSSIISEQVDYGFLGLGSPYAPPPMTFNVKRTMPLKWQYTNAGGAVVNSATANPAITIQGPYSCGGTDSASTITVNDAGTSGYQYDSTTNTWQFNWQVKGNLPGCYDVFIKSQQSGQTNGAFPIGVINQ